MPSGVQVQSAIGELVSYDTPTSQFFPCTATVVSSVSQDVIVTAAHCVSDFVDGGDGHIFANFQFAPEHTDVTCAPLTDCGSNPYGVWSATASDVYVMPNVGGQQKYDMAFIRLHRDDGSKVAQAVGGGLPIQFNSATSEKWTAWGLPSGDQISPGQYALSVRSCSGTSQDDSNDESGPGPDPLLIPSGCSALKPGSSGGPWLNAQERIGAVNKATGAGELGTYLGTDALDLFLSASLGS